MWVVDEDAEEKEWAVLRTLSLKWAREHHELEQGNGAVDWLCWSEQVFCLGQNEFETCKGQLHHLKNKYLN